MDLREYWENNEEALRVLVDGARKQLVTALPVIVHQDADGHTAVLKIAVKGRQVDPVTGQLKHVDFPLLQDVPIHFPQGGGTVHTFPIKKGDEGFVVFSSRHIDAWHQSGDVQQTVDVRTHSLSDGMFVPGHRSTPRKIQNNSTESAHLRSDDGKHTHETHPQNGFKTKSVDPSDNASNPFKDAQKFFESILHPTNGIAHNATDSGTTHSITNTHDAGPTLSAANGAHTHNVHPTDGISLKSIAKVLVQAASHDIQAPTSIAGGLSADSVQGDHGSFGSLSVPGGIGAAGGGAPLASGAAAANVGELGGDLAGELPDPQVVGITHVANAHMLPVAANDAAAAALTPPVPVGGLYINQTAVSGQNLICVRMT